MSDPKALTASEFRQELSARGILRQIDAARMLGVSEAAISLYLNGKRPIPQVVTVALRSIRKLRQPIGDEHEPVGTSKD